MRDSRWTSAETTVQHWTAPSNPIRAAVWEVRRLHQLEHAGESEWTPWLALAGLIVFFLTIATLMFGIVEGAFHLLASASLV